MFELKQGLDSLERPRERYGWTRRQSDSLSVYDGVDYLHVKARGAYQRIRQ